MVVTVFPPASAGPVSVCVEGKRDVAMVFSTSKLGGTTDSAPSSDIGADDDGGAIGFDEMEDDNRSVRLNLDLWGVPGVWGDLS